MRLNDGKGLISHKYYTDELIDVEDFVKMSVIEQRNFTNYLALYTLNKFSNTELIENDLFNVCLGGVEIQQTGYRSTGGGATLIKIRAGIILSFRGYLNKGDWSLVPGEGEVTAICIPEDVDFEVIGTLGGWGNLEIKCVPVTLEESNRKFRNPSTLAISESNVDTRVHFATEIQFRDSGSASVAPAVADGWVKIAEMRDSQADADILSIYESEQWTTGNEITQHINKDYRKALFDHTLSCKLHGIGGESTQFVHGSYTRIGGKAIWVPEKDMYYIAGELDGTSSYWYFGYSQNGKDWVFNDIAGDLEGVGNVAYSPELDRFVVTGANSTGGAVVFYSDAGSVTVFTSVALSHTSNSRVYDILWCDDLQIFCGVFTDTGASGSYSIVSSDGISWSENLIDTGTTPYVSNITYSSKLQQFCCCFGFSNVFSYTSTNGTSWTKGDEVDQGTPAINVDINTYGQIALIYSDTMNMYVCLFKASPGGWYPFVAFVSRDGVYWSSYVFVTTTADYTSTSAKLGACVAIENMGCFIIAGAYKFCFMSKNGVVWESMSDSSLCVRSIEGRLGSDGTFGVDNFITSIVWNPQRSELLVVKNVAYVDDAVVPLISISVS